MSRRYLVGVADYKFQKRAFGIVSAPDRYEAIMRFLEDFVPTSTFAVEYILGTAINWSLAEIFWFKSDEEYHEYSIGEAELISEEAFRQRVRRFFSDSPHGDEYADLYSEWYFSQCRAEETADRI